MLLWVSHLERKFLSPLAARGKFHKDKSVLQIALVDSFPFLWHPKNKLLHKPLKAQPTSELPLRSSSTGEKLEALREGQGRTGTLPPRVLLPPALPLHSLPLTRAMALQTDSPRSL